jgi:NADPH-dependent 2,4-dienoyl-CoA reductase/sulfur reductase-like enzyme
MPDFSFWTPDGTLTRTAVMTAASIRLGGRADMEIKVAVVVAGVMGAGVAQNLAQTGHDFVGVQA